MRGNEACFDMAGKIENHRLKQIAYLPALLPQKRNKLFRIQTGPFAAPTEAANTACITAIYKGL